MERLILLTLKKCPDPTCGKVHTEIPEQHKLMQVGDLFDGYYYNCACGSTFLAKISQVMVLRDGESLAKKEAA